MDNEKKLTTEELQPDAAELEATETPEAEPIGDEATAAEPLDAESTDLAPTEDETPADPPRFTAKTTLNAAVQLEASKPSYHCCSENMDYSFIFLRIFLDCQINP